MANNLSNVSFRIDSNVKQQADSLFAALGMNMTTAFNLFLRQALREEGIPFTISNRPNKETVAAMLEAERIGSDPNVKHYTDVEEALRELKA
jgi:DNA-damage-inducible protein J